MITSAEEFVALRTSENPEEYSRAATEAASLAVWADVNARFPAFRRWVAHNKTIPDEVIRDLARDEDPDVRRMIASKRKTPADVLTMLAHDPDASVRARVACNAKVPTSLLVVLSSDPEPIVREATRDRLSARELRSE